MKKNFILLIVLIFASCSNNENLGNGYYYLPDYEALDIGYPYGATVYKSTRKNHFNSIVIDSDIIGVNYNDNYIIVKQKPNREFMITRLIDDLETLNSKVQFKKDSVIIFNGNKISLVQLKRLFEKNTKNQIMDSLIKSSSLKGIFLNEENYYIIEKHNDSIFGPLTLSNFNSLKKKYNIDIEFE